MAKKSQINKIENKKQKINTFSPSYILRFVYIGFLEIFLLNKKRREKEGLITIDVNNKPLEDYIYAGTNEKKEKAKRNRTKKRICIQSCM